MTLNPIHDSGLFQCSLKTSGNLWFSDVFQKVYKKTTVMKWVEDILTNIFFYMGFFSQTFTKHRTAGEGGGHSQTLRH